MIRIEHLDEPKLTFAQGTHVCPRHGMSKYGVFDQSNPGRSQEINMGSVGTSRCLEFLDNWISRCRTRIEVDEDTKQKNMRYPFCGFTKKIGFYADIIMSDLGSRTIRHSEIGEILKIKERHQRVTSAVDIYYEHIKFLVQNRPTISVIVCVIPDDLFNSIAAVEEAEVDSLEDADDRYEELNFRRALKAKSMLLGKPIQIIREASLIETDKPTTQQDDATKAWNFCTALYYKAGGTVPWKLIIDKNIPTSCAVGISFYKSRDHQSLGTSLAQVFDELGNGIILRGTHVEISKDNRTPRLSTQQSYELLNAALKEYRKAMNTFPARLVIHKSSNFIDDEIEGIEAVATESNIHTVDYVTVMDSTLRLFRNGNYPPLRGTLGELGNNKQLLYTRGSVWFYQTYPGSYIPQPLELRIAKSEVSPRYIATEILGLTKMNWNNTAFDGKYPVTIGCARKVGDILKYLDESDVPHTRYGFYM